MKFEAVDRERLVAFWMLKTHESDEDFLQFLFIKIRGKTISPGSYGSWIMHVGVKRGFSGAYPGCKFFMKSPETR